MTPNVYNYRDAAGGFFNEKKLPMALIKPFGYSAKRSQLQIACFWSWLVFGSLCHLWKWISTKKIREAQELAEAEKQEAATNAGKGSEEESEEGVKTLEMQETVPSDNDVDASKNSVGTSSDEENQA